jgi:hypothetical protein
MAMTEREAAALDDAALHREWFRRYHLYEKDMPGLEILRFEIARRQVARTIGAESNERN